MMALLKYRDNSNVQNDIIFFRSMLYQKARYCATFFLICIFIDTN